MPSEVFEGSVKIIQEMKHNRGGFALMPSCDLPIDAKSQNIDTMFDAVKKFK